MNRLSRDYKQQPLGPKELVPFEDLVYLFIELNYCYEKMSKIIGKSANSIAKQCKKHGLIKTKEKHKESLENYYLETIGVKNPAQLQSSKDKANKKYLEKYGVENIAFKKETIQKRKQTCLEKYGVDNPAKCEQIKDKIKQTNNERYGKDYVQQNKAIRQKQYDTMIKRYGCKTALQNKQIKQKQEQTCLERYGTKNPFENKQIQEKYYNKIQQQYGVDNIAQLESSKEATKRTCLEKYGYENPLQVPQFHEKQKQTMIEKYGVTNASQYKEFQEKKYATMTENNTWWGNSKEEQYIYEQLITKYDVIRQYKCEEYPFLCDFYIPELNLFMEYQGFVSHGNHAYTGSQQDLELLDFWWNKVYELAEDNNEQNAYLQYIHTWTVTDPLKRQTAKENNLNWIEFFTLEEFIEWFKNN